ncbi:4Fe-4S binding protein [candidate division KSB1 bacterium]|nr:4Fe-4S binding protein [candidate division KSB1 bacterium]
MKKHYLFLLLSICLPQIMPAAENHNDGAFTFFQTWSFPKFWIGAVLALGGMFLLYRARVTKTVRTILLAVAFFAFSIVSMLPLGDFAAGMGLHPSPMCVVEKPFLFVQRGYAVPMLFFSIFTFIVILTVLGNKLFCGWNCPIGALQELIFQVPLPKKWKIKLPFWATNIIRIGFFGLFVFLVFSIGFSIYAYLNPFEFLHWRFDWLLLIPFGITFVAALFVFRPFCYLICPLGLFTWVFEQLSVFRVSVITEKCNNCNLCAVKSPCPAVPAILAGKKIRPDCYACGECLSYCPDNALKYGFRIQRRNE